MSLLMSLVFALLVIEMVIITIICLPLPQGIQKKIVNAAYSALMSQQVKVGILFIGGVVSLLFLDSLKSSFSPEGSGFVDVMDAGSHGTAMRIGRSIWDVRVKQFYAQRNMYISGAVLFLLVAIYFNVLLLESIVRNKEKLSQVADVKPDGDRKTTSLEYEQLKEELKKKEIDAATLRKQLDGAHREYQAAADRSSSAAAAATAAAATTTTTTNEKVPVEKKKDA